MAKWLNLNYRHLQVYVWQNEATPVPLSTAKSTYRLLKTNLLGPKTTAIT